MAKLSRRERERLVREESMVEAAERLFSEHGFENVSMDAIAKEAEFTKRSADIDAKKGACTVAFALTGFFSMLSETGKTFTEHFALDQEEFSLFALDLFSDALRVKI